MLHRGSLCKEIVVGSVIALFYLAGLLAPSDVLQTLVSHSSRISLVCPGSLEELYCVAAYTYTVHIMLDARWCQTRFVGWWSLLVSHGGRSFAEHHP